MKIAAQTFRRKKSKIDQSYRQNKEFSPIENDYSAEIELNQSKNKSSMQINENLPRININNN